MVCLRYAQHPHLLSSDRRLRYIPVMTSRVYWHRIRYGSVVLANGEDEEIQAGSSSGVRLALHGRGCCCCCCCCSSCCSMFISATQLLQPRRSGLFAPFSPLPPCLCNHPLAPSATPAPHPPLPRPPFFYVFMACFNIHGSTFYFTSPTPFLFVPW